MKPWRSLHDWKKSKSIARDSELEHWTRDAYPDLWAGPYRSVTVEECSYVGWVLQRYRYKNLSDLLGSNCGLTYHRTRAGAKRAGSIWLQKNA